MRKGSVSDKIKGVDVRTGIELLSPGLKPSEAFLVLNYRTNRDCDLIHVCRSPEL
jgi:hypothetical protein